VVLEAALLNVKAGEGERFEAAMERARPLIAATPGFLGMELRPSLEEAGQYLLLVRWERLEDHTVGFRQSERYAAWRAALHHFYEPFPDVRHFGDPL
jgi:heme-degrading monooxygenase HmoA